MADRIRLGRLVDEGRVIFGTLRAESTLIVQVVLSWLPGYIWDGHNLTSTGGAIRPTQHINPANGEIRYYCRPIFRDGPTVGLYVRKKGIQEAIERGVY